MKPFKIQKTILVIFIAAAASCSKSSNSSTTSCTVTTGDTGPLSSGQQVTYGATVSNGASISTLSYQDSAGTTLVNNPTLPFVKTVNLKSGQTVAITAKGNPGAGEITVASNGISPNTASCP